MKTHDLDDSITLTNEKVIEVNIKSKSIHSPRLNLGHYKAPKGDGTIQKPS